MAFAFLGGCSSSPAVPSITVPAWESAAGAALTPVAQQESMLAQQEQKWEAGTTATADFKAELATSQSVMDQGLASVARLPGYPGQPDVVRMYRAALALYVTVPEIQLAATSLPTGDLRTQVMRISDRVRELGDRIFDQGRVLTAQGLTPPGLPAGSDVELPLEVPDWVAEGLAAGPPLAPAPPAAAQYPPTREGPRPTEPRAAWQAYVDSTGAPSASTVAGAVASGSASTAGALAQQLQVTATAIGRQPDPAVTDGREVSDRLRLGLLIEAEALRLRQAQLDGPSAPLGAPASALLAVQV